MALVGKLIAPEAKLKGKRRPLRSMLMRNTLGLGLGLGLGLRMARYLGDLFLGAKSTDMSVLGCSCVTFER